MIDSIKMKKQWRKGQTDDYHFICPFSARQIILWTCSDYERYILRMKSLYTSNLINLQKQKVNIVKYNVII